MGLPLLRQPGGEPPLSFVSFLEGSLRDHRSREGGEGINPDALKFQQRVKRSLVMNPDGSPGGMTVLAITSTVEAGTPTEGVRYGIGKTTLAMRLCRKWSHYHPEVDGGRFSLPDAEDLYSQSEEGYEPVNRNIWDDPQKMKLALQERLVKGIRTKVAIWDDVQERAPSQQGKGRGLANLVGDMQKWRYYVGLLILTFPGMGEIHSSVGRLVDFEAVVPKSGFVNLQEYRWQRDYRHPRRPRERMRALSAGQAFGPLPPIEQRWYNEWRTRGMLKGTAAPADQQQRKDEFF